MIARDIEEALAFLIPCNRTGAPEGPPVSALCKSLATVTNTG
jgi:hypothetical protein